MINSSAIRKKLVLFDFDGTIADTMLPGLRISNKLADKYHYQKVQLNELAEFRGKSSKEVLKRINLPWYKLPFVTRSFRKAMQNEIGTIPPFKGIYDAIKGLHEKGYQLGIITSNAEGNINEFLHNNKLDIYFSVKRCGISLFKKHYYINRLLDKMDMKPEEVVLVADETRDIEAAKKSEIEMIAVTWGFHPKSTLEKLDPDHLIDSPDQLLDIL